MSIKIKVELCQTLDMFDWQILCSRFQVVGCGLPTIWLALESGGQRNVDSKLTQTNQCLLTMSGWQNNDDWINFIHGPESKPFF